MRTLVLALALGLAAITAHAQREPDPTPLLQQQTAKTPELSRSAATRKAEPGEVELLSHGHYKTRDGREVHAPAKSIGNVMPAGASAQCRDGSYSFSQHRRGTCSHHGGVEAWL